MDTTAKLARCRSTRRIAAQSLKRSLESGPSLSALSEAQMRDAWLTALRGQAEIFPDGWYIPPPHGIGVLFGTATQDSRMNYRSLRSGDTWPKETVFLSDEHPMVYLYASPVDRETGTIGDFGMTLYTGKDPVVKDHLKRCLQINQELFVYATIDMPFSQFYRQAQDLFTRYHLSNMITSSTDPAGVNIGHTVPLCADGEWARLMKEKPPWSAICATISNKRQFLNGIESQRFLPGMAVTLEPRLVDVENPQIPMSSFHTIMIFQADGTKELLTDFDDLFALMQMDYMTS